MKKIINGLRYDTDTAELIGSYDNLGNGADSRTDFRHWEASLYRTPRSGRYFLAGSGGPMTRFARATGQNSWSGGDDLLTLEPSEALVWAEQFLAPELVERAFADMIKDA